MNISTLSFTACKDRTSEDVPSLTTIHNTQHTQHNPPQYHTICTMGKFTQFHIYHKYTQVATLPHMLPHRPTQGLIIMPSHRHFKWCTAQTSIGHTDHILSTITFTSFTPHIQTKVITYPQCKHTIRIHKGHSHCTDPYSIWIKSKDTVSTPTPYQVYDQHTSQRFQAKIDNFCHTNKGSSYPSPGLRDRFKCWRTSNEHSKEFPSTYRSTKAIS